MIVNRYLTGNDRIGNIHLNSSHPIKNELFHPGLRDLVNYI